MDGRGRFGGFFGGLSLFLDEAAVEAFLFNLKFLVFELESFVRGGLADPVVPVLVDNGTPRLAEGAGEFRGTELKQQNKNHQIREAENEDSPDGAKDGRDGLVV